MLNTIADLSQVVTVVIALPVGAWRAWKSIDHRLDEQNERMIRVEAQFFKNGGSSMKDDVTVLKEGLANIKGHLGL